MQCNDVEQVLEQSGSVQLPDAAQAHVAGCPSCTALIADFQAILTAASEFPAEVDPPARVWVALQAQLEAEGIIRQPKVAPEPKAAWWHGLFQVSRGRMWATAAVAGLVLVVGLVQMKHPVTPPAAAGGAGVAAIEPFADAATTLDQEEQSLGPMQPASTMASADSVDDSLRENLAKVNAFIKECRKRLAEHPNDQMARDYLAVAYQQKAEILAAMMERGRSVN
jgi:hypothetical protein